MSLKKTIQSSLIISLLFAPLCSLADIGPNYQIEVVIFSRLNTQTLSQEDWPILNSPSASSSI